MNRYLTIATDTNVLNLVALAALADAGDEVLLLADARMRKQGSAERLERGLAARGLIVKCHELTQWSLDPMTKAAQAAFADWGSGSPTSLEFMAIGGRKHDALVLHELLRQQASACGARLGAVSVDRRPLMLRRSTQMTNGQLQYKAVALSALDRDRRVGLDEVLALHGYPRAGGTYVPPGGRMPQVSQPDSGQKFELAVLELVHTFLTSATAPYLNELWWGVKVSTPSGRDTATEFDVLLLACDGSVVHFECKTDPKRSTEMQHKAFQMRQIFTPESRFVICHAVHSGMAAEAMDELSDKLLKRYENVGAFDLVLFNQRRRPNLALSERLPAPAAAIRQVLETAWITPA